MKKIILVAAMVLGFAVAASAQPRAIGLRGGWGAELSYQHTLGENFVEAELGFWRGGLSVAGNYNWTLVKPQWTNKGEWGVYAGPGAAAGFYKGAASVAVTGMVGLEYTFDFPLQLSIDIRPQVGIVMGGGSSALYIGDLVPALGIRYRF